MSSATLVGHGIKHRLGGWVIERDGTRGVTRRATEHPEGAIQDTDGQSRARRGRC
jgi:hypothetical protein